MFYTPDNLKEFDYYKNLGDPGVFPFSRGIHPAMYQGKLWTMRQYAGFGSAKETNTRFKYLLSKGQTGLSIAFDLPTQLGYDSDHPKALGEIGRCGAVVDSLADFEELFQDIPLDKISVSMTINAPALIILAMYIALAEKQNISLNKLQGTIQNDILKEYLARGNYIFPIKVSLKLCIDLIEYASLNLPKWNPISISGYHIREAGANAVQELAFTLANGITYLEEALKRNLKPALFLKGFSFFFASGNNFFEEIAKFRAARFLWANILKEGFKINDPDLIKFKFHAQTSGSALTLQQPLNNIVRVTLQALAAVFGGAQSLHTNSYNEAISLPSEEAVKLALRTQQIIAYESKITETADPLGGSYYLESLTLEMIKKVKAYLKVIQEKGGVISAYEEKYFQTEIQESAYLIQKNIEDKKEIIVGVNEFKEEEEEIFKFQKISSDLEEKQKEKLNLIKSQRDNLKIKEVLKEIKENAKDSLNLMPLILKAVKVYATIGEICGALREVFGEYALREF
ncbi:MAG: methylmalonyl-CoA mutase [Armatimonadetes bacterium]|nr:methylmalonyl-CoA mutase [Armatimonadota bacterium]